MSVDATRWAWGQKLTSSQKLVLLKLADRADVNNSCYPSISSLSVDTSLHRETIFKAIDEMVSIGIIQVDKVVGRSNRYVLKLDKTSTDILTSMEKHTSKKKPTTTSTDIPTGVYEKPDGYQYEKPDTNLKETKSNLKVESKRSAKDIAYAFFAGIDEEIITTYLAVRKAKRAPAVSQIVVNALQRESAKAGITVEQAIVVCCERNWVGFNSDWYKPAVGLTKLQNIKNNNDKAINDFVGSGTVIDGEIIDG